MRGTGSVRFILLLALLFGCAAPRVAVNPRYDFSKVRRVAVLPFAGSGGESASDFLARSLLGGGADVVERGRLDAVLREQDLRASNRLDPKTTQRIGRLLGVDAIFMGTVTQYEPPRSYLIYKEPQPEVRGLVSEVVVEESEERKKGKGSRQSSTRISTQVGGGSHDHHTVTQIGARQVYGQGPALGLPGGAVVTSYATVGLSARMVDVRTGSVVWSAHYSYEGFDLETALASVTGEFVRSLRRVWLSKT